MCRKSGIADWQLRVQFHVSLYAELLFDTGDARSRSLPPLRHRRVEYTTDVRGDMTSRHPTSTSPYKGGSQTDYDGNIPDLGGQGPSRHATLREATSPSAPSCLLVSAAHEDYPETPQS